ncbi:phage tail protein [Aeromonas veronii]
MLASVADAIAGTDEQKAVTPKGALEAAFSAYPVGAPIPWPTAVPPPGFIAMTGQSFSATTYPKLAIAYPSLVLPDMRAEFIRGWDNGRGIDSGRALLSSKIDNIKTTVGTLNDGLAGVGVSTTGVCTWTPSGTVSIGTGVSTARTGTIGVAFGSGSETYPYNIAFNYIVRAA